MFDFSHSNIGTMPNEDIYGQAGDIGDITAGINPSMRRAMDRQSALDRQDELMYRQLASQGNPLMLALAYPDRFYRQTGMAVDIDPEFGMQLYDQSMPEGIKWLRAHRDTQLAERQVQDSAKRVQSAIGDMMLQRDSEAYNSPVATALRQLDPETAKRLAMAQSGYTKTYGYGGAPSEYEQKIGAQRVANEPGLAETQRKKEEFAEEKPEREFKLRAGEKALTTKDVEMKVNALGNELKEMQKIVDSTFVSMEDRANAIRRMGEIAQEMREVLGMAKTNAPGNVDPAHAQQNPHLYKDKTFIVNTPKGRRLWKSNGKTWVDIGPAPA